MDDTLIEIQRRLSYTNISSPCKIHSMNINQVPTMGQAIY